MKNSDEAVDRVLAGLREVEAPAGLERRVLAAMAERAAGRHGWWPVRWAWACAVVAVGVAGAFMLRPTPVRVEKVAVATVQPVQVERVQERNTEILRVAQNDLKRGNSRSSQVVPVAVDEPVAAGGFPAPPMPLTDAEKLLLRVAHRADATELTPLNAEARERQSAEFDAEFLEFFAVPAFVGDETDSMQEDKGETR